MKFRKRPVEVEAIQWMGSDHREMYIFLSGDTEGHIRAEGEEFEMDHNRVKGGLVIKTNEGDMAADIGDWIIREPFPTSDRKFYPCKPDIFEKTYEKVED